MDKGKLWGETSALVVTPLCEIHRIRVFPDGFCSWHHHDRKWNAFAVIKGTLTIEVDEDSEGPKPRKFVSRLYLTEGQVTAIPPGKVHRFVNHFGERVEALEVYYPDVLGEDIVRHSIGGVL